MRSSLCLYHFKSDTHFLTGQQWFDTTDLNKTEGWGEISTISLIFPDLQDQAKRPIEKLGSVIRLLLRLFQAKLFLQFVGELILKPGAQHFPVGFISGSYVVLLNALNIGELFGVNLFFF